MRIFLFFFVLIFTLTACEDKFAKEKYDVQFTVKNTSQEVVLLKIDETEGRIYWEKSLNSGDTFQITFNIKEDIKVSEGGFIFTAIFPDGQTIETNTGYFTNYQIGGKRSQHYEITNEKISELVQ